MRILIAEDDPVSRRLLEATLTKWEYEVIVTCDGDEALKHLLAPDPPRLAILDWMMPGVDGVRLCQEIRKRIREPYIYILMLTAKSQKDETIEGINSGADDYLIKPFDSNELKARLNAGKRIMDLQTDLLLAQEDLRNQATHDSLTGLPNRLLFSERLNYSLAQAHRRKEMMAVIFLDLDNFKLVNDSLGHSVGDALLKKAAQRLKKTLRDVDTVARMGGDEFTIAITGVKSPDDVERVAQKTLHAFSKAFKVNGREIFITPSLGISMYPMDGTDTETLVKNADAAMYMAKERGRNNYHLCSEYLKNRTVERITLESNLHKALQRGELFLHYQPRLGISNGKVLGVEALIRWQHPEFGLIPPAQFIPVAEENGLIASIGRFVLHSACAQNKAWQDMGFESMEVAVNVSPRQFYHEGLQETIREILEETRLAPKYLVLEITESMLMQNPEVTVDILQRLVKMGVSISIDDFGTGCSSLSYLKRFPIRTVKIDQSFVREISTNPDDAAIVSAVIAMAHNMNLRVIAEGVETLVQLEYLRALGCDEMQGYFVGRPVPSAEFEMLLKEEGMIKGISYFRSAA